MINIDQPMEISNRHLENAIIQKESVAKLLDFAR
jgi:hypothetical protein